MYLTTPIPSSSRITGDLGAIQQVEQMHFVPLGDVICDAVAQLNRQGLAATEQAIRQYVARHCPHVAPPGIEMVSFEGPSSQPCGTRNFFLESFDLNNSYLSYLWCYHNLFN